ncbi:MAG: hypothetical protein ACSLEZ_05455 [Thiobacillus sp.]
MSDLSPLEEHFPRLVSDILACWGTPTCFERLQDLLVDKRGGRQGFPAEVYSDLFMLLTLVPEPKGPYDIWSDAQDVDTSS